MHTEKPEHAFLESGKVVTAKIILVFYGTYSEPLYEISGLHWVAENIFLSSKQIKSV